MGDRGGGYVDVDTLAEDVSALSVRQLKTRLKGTAQL